MSLAGKNTPQSVLAYIDAIWARNAPVDPIQLAQELGYQPKAIRGLKEKHGDKLLAYLERVRRNRTEVPRFMANQQGQYHPQQYISSAQGAIDEDEAVDELSQRRITEQAKVSERDAIGELLVTLEDLRAAVRDRLEMSPDARRIMGRDAWALRSKIDAIERRLKRRHAA